MYILLLCVCIGHLKVQPIVDKWTKLRHGQDCILWKTRDDVFFSGSKESSSRTGHGPLCKWPHRRIK